MEFRIVELSKERLEEAINFIEGLFKIDSKDLDHPRRFLPASLSPDTERSKKIYRSTQCKEVKYFMAIDKKLNKIIGIIGYYANKFDSKEADWLAWFAVNPNYRREGIGKKLLEFIKKNSIKRRKKFLRLYTDPEEEKEAQLFYEKIGLREVKRKRLPYIKNGNIIYREMKL